jgi:hypothetical protein
VYGRKRWWRGKEGMEGSGVNKECRTMIDYQKIGYTTKNQVFRK